MTEDKKSLCSDKELMALLERSPQQGTEELFDRYAGLVWSGLWRKNIWTIRRM